MTGHPGRLVALSGSGFTLFGGLLLAALVDLFIFALCFRLTVNILFSILVGRFTIGPCMNYYMNRKLVFHSAAPGLSSALKYTCLLLVMAFLSFASIRILVDHLTMNVYTAKIVAETFLFLISFVVQRDLVFAGQHKRGRNDH